MLFGRPGQPLRLPAGLPAADLLQLVLPAVAGFHGPDPAFQIIHILYRAPVLLHGLAVLLGLSLAHVCLSSFFPRVALPVTS